jgi:PAS domain S-box-containing protein
MRRSPGKMIASLPIRQKISAIVMLTTVCALLIACSAFIVYDFRSVRESTARDLTTLAGVVASNSAAALMFQDVQACGDILSGLRERPSITAAAIYSTDGRALATYGVLRAPALGGNGASVVADNQGIRVFRRIRFRGEVIGTLYVASDLREMQRRMHMQVCVAGGILAFAIVLALIMTTRLQGFVTDRLLELAGTARRVTREKDYSVRVAERDGPDDEIGAVILAFNEMLEQIEKRDAALGRNHAELERQVMLRTAELSAANEELLIAKTNAEVIGEINSQLHRESALILNSATDGIIGIGLDGGRPTFMNPAAASMLGRSLTEFKGRSFHELVHHSHPDGTPWPRADCPLGGAVRCGEPFPLSDGAFWRADGSSFPVEYSAMPMRDENGTLHGAVMVFRDVTERRAVERLKNEFVSTVSHELRTPLTSIRGALGLLSSGLLGPIAEKAQRMLEIAVSNTDRLVRLINDILDLERIQSGKVELVRKRVSASDVMEQSLEGLQAIADQAGVSLRIEPQTGELWGDSDRIIQTLTNLLGNAIKFSPPGTAVTLSGVRGDRDFMFCVADEGRGVPEEKLGTIFERFSQVDASDSRDKGGSGLGLAICQSIVNAHGGSIWAETNEPVGSRFRFTIPLAPPAVIPARVVPEPAEFTNRARQLLVNDELSRAVDLLRAVDLVRSPVSVLVVEDDLDLAGVMTTALQSRGIRTFHAATGNDAVELCAEHEPTLIVLDIGLPDMDGFAVVSALRGNPTLAKTPLLVYSAMDVVGADQSRLRLGPTEFLTKSRSSLADFEEHVIQLLDTVTARKKEDQDAA